MNEENFEKIYNQTYQNTLNYIIIHCNDIHSVNDIIQETYIELYKILSKRELKVDNIQNYIIGIAKKKIYHHYSIIQKIRSITLFNKKDNMNYEIDIPSLENIENDIFNKLEAEEIWNYLKKKRVEVVKVFYLYFYLDFKISEIAHILNMSDSKVKNILYRNIKEMKERINKDV